MPEADAPRAGGRGGAKVGLLLAASVLSLVLGELALRAFDLGALTRLPAPNRVDPERLVHQIDDDPAIAWSLRPGATATLGGIDVHINSLGCRGPEPLAGRPLVVIVGDSIAWGAGLVEADLLATRLAMAIRSRGGVVDVLSCGVSGYNLRQTLARYERDLAAASPALVVLSLFADDLGPQYRMLDQSWPAWWRDRSFLFRAIEYGWATARGQRFWATAGAEERRAAEAALGTWVRRRRLEGRSLVALVHPMLSPRNPGPGGNMPLDVLEVTTAAGLDTIHVEDLYVAEVGADLPSLSIHPRSHDPHPNGRATRILAKALLDWIDHGGPAALQAPSGPPPEP